MTSEDSIAESADTSSTDSEVSETENEAGHAKSSAALPRTTSILRSRWPRDFPPCYFHAAWQSQDPSIPCLMRHPSQEAAKSDGDVEAAISVVDFLSDDYVLDLIYDKILPYRLLGDVYVVAPIKPPDVNRNALALTYAQAIADFCECRLDENIFQSNSFKRDRTSVMDRLALPPSFYGHVIPGGNYVLVDDVLTSGGTFASLMCYIQQCGGTVILTTTLCAGSAIAPRASAPTAHRDISVDLPISASKLNSLLHIVADERSSLENFFRERLLYELETLTDHEGTCLINWFDKLPREPDSPRRSRSPVERFISRALRVRRDAIEA